MIEKKEALEIARKYYLENGNQEITKFYDSEKSWIAFGGHAGLAKIGNIGIAIDKECGEISDFLLPSKENFELLKKAVLVETE
ncbi:MAG: hypothetical protein ACI4V6_05995 [Dorea sp.]